ncbi:MAG: leucyl aminopeptidase [Phaeodactylibacter sp.]|nr:leucyl aminopeptidase [Phaeodactylibacter sp.]
MRIEILTNFESHSPTIFIPFFKDQPFQVVLDQSPLKGTALNETNLKSSFKADYKEFHTFWGETDAGLSQFFFIGLGSKLDFAKTIQAFRSLAFKNKSKLSKTVSLLIPASLEAEDAGRLVEAAVNGIALSRYNVGLFKTEETNEECPFVQADARLELIVPNNQVQAARQAAEKGQAIAETQMRIFDLVNAPSNKKTAEMLAQWAMDSAATYEYQVEVLDKAAITELGLNAVLAVNQGSPDPATFSILEYRPAGSGNYPKVGLVGKGVTFDTGGLSIKPSSNMHYMKSDMGGAAAVFGTLELCAILQLPYHVIGIVPATDNSVDAHSIKPSDVIFSYGGKSIEIIDTDAEGRLILADGLTYMVKHYQPDVLIDLATLTGSCIRTLGYAAGGLFSNNDALAEQLLNAGQHSGERLWRLPIWEEYGDYMKSDVADIKNFSGKPLAGAITAAKFLEFFIEGHSNWAHLDIAGMAVSDTEYGSQKMATAFGIRLLIQFLESLSERPSA